MQNIEEAGHTFKVWVEVEELDEVGDHVTYWSAYLDGGAVAAFDTVESAIRFGNALQIKAWNMEEDRR